MAICNSLTVGLCFVFQGSGEHVCLSVQLLSKRVGFDCGDQADNEINKQIFGIH